MHALFRLTITFMVLLWLLPKGNLLAQPKADAVFAQKLVAAHERLQFPDTALLLLNQLDANRGGDSLQTEYYRIKGAAYFYKGILDSAIVYFYTASSLIEDSICTKQSSTVANGLGVILHKVKYYDKAIDQYTKALICIEERGDDRLKLKLLINLGILNREVGNVKESAKFVQKAMSLAKQKDDQSALASIYNSMGQNYIQAKKLDSAIIAFNQSLAFRDEDDPMGRALVLNNLGFVSSLLGKHNEALEYYHLSEVLRKKTGDLEGSASLYVNIGNIYLDMNDLVSARQYFDNASILNKKVNSPQIQERILRSMAHYWEQQGNLEKSHEALQLFMDQKDSLDQYSSIQKIAASPYQIALLEAENKAQKIQEVQAERTASLERQRMINLALTIGISVIIGVLALFIYQLKMLSNLRSTLMEERDIAKRSAEDRRHTLNTVVHEIKAPMEAIVSLADLIIEEEDPTEIQQMARLMQKSSRRLVNTTNNVLTFSRLEQGNLPLAEHEENLSILVQDICDMLEPKIKAKNLHLVRSIAPDVVFRTDLAVIEIVLINLLTNAVKYTDEGEIKVRLVKTEEHIQMEVSDSGRGISDEERAKIFEPFYRSGNQDKFNRDGAGLGLYICKYYVELLGADLVLNSKLGLGSTFSVIIPTQRQQA